MGFWDVVKTVGEAAYEGMQAKAESIRRYREEYESCDDERLLRMCRSASGDRRVAILSILKERGYTADDIQSY